MDLQRFLTKVEIGEDHWLWKAACNSGGYGTFSWKGKSSFAHRFSYEHYVGDIPDGLDIDHLCRVRLCVNPEHLEAVTRTENLQRGDPEKRKGLYQRSKTHCPQGHEYSVENTGHSTGNRRYCKECKRLQYWKGRG